MTTGVDTWTEADEAMWCRRTAKMLVFGQAAVVVSYFLLAFIPYFAHGMDRPEAARADIEAADLFPNSYTILLSVFDVTLGPFIAGVLAVWGVLLLARRWEHLPWLMRAVLFLSAVATEAFVVVNAIDVGARVRGWVVD